jgi:ACT domain-containing protein
MDIARKPILSYSLLITLLFLFPLSSAFAASTQYCPYTTTSKCAAWLSSKDEAYDFANTRYWKYKDFVNPFGVLNLEMKVLTTADKMHLFKDNRTEQNTLNTQWLNTYTKLTKKAYYDTRLSRQEFYVFHGNYVFHVMTKSESRVSKSGKWQSSKNCIAIDGIWDCYSIKNSDWSWL